MAPMAPLEAATLWRPSQLQRRCGYNFVVSVSVAWAACLALALAIGALQGPVTHETVDTGLLERRLESVSNASTANAIANTTAVGAPGNSSATAGAQAALPEKRNDTEKGSFVTEKGSFDYHKPPFPLDWHHDGLTILLSMVGLMIAASGGIGGGGILVPLFMLVLGFRPKHAIALSNFTILGGSMANTFVNVRKRHPELDRPLIDWDLILIMEPFTIFGAVFGSLLSKVLPNIILTISLVLILAFMGQRTLKKGHKMWTDESKRQRNIAGSSIEMLPSEMLEPVDSIRAVGETGNTPMEGMEDGPSYRELQSDNESGPADELGVRAKVGALVVCFVGTCIVTILKGGGKFASPLGFDCGSQGFWLLYFGSLPWVLAFAAYFRCLLVGEFQSKLRKGHIFIQGEVQWDSWNTIKYPAICAISGLLAGLFGVGGGIVKGPLMLEMGIQPSVASASAAAMILFTSATASTSFVVFGLLHTGYGAIFLILGVISTALGQYVVGQLVEKYNRQSPIVLSIGSVIALSSLLVAINTFATLLSPDAGTLFVPHGVCSSEA